MTKFLLCEARPDLSGLFENLRVTKRNGRRIKTPNYYKKNLTRMNQVFLFYFFLSRTSSTIPKLFASSDVIQ